MDAATRDVFGKHLLELGHKYPEVVVVNCDLATSTRTLEFKKSFPERFVECGISEANAVSVAAGLAQEGLRPLVCSFGHFLTGKFLEIFQSIGLNNSGVVLVGTHAGLAIGKDGPSQMGLRDLALMRLLPNMSILHPADEAETRQALDYAVSGRQPIYLRLCRQPAPAVHAADYRFRFGSPSLLRARGTLLIVAQGASVAEALGAADRLERRGKDVGVMNLSSLPYGREELLRLIAPYRHLLVVEDHYSRGGLAEDLALTLALSKRPLLMSQLAIDDYAQSGSPEELYRRYRLDADGIEAEALGLLSALDPE